MIKPGVPQNEIERLSSLYSYHLLDTLPEDNIDAITTIASQLCGTNISLVTLLDADRQWFKSVVGLEGTETPRELSFCAHAILQDSSEPFIIEDPAHDARFSGNPFVTGEPHVAFYAGVPLINKEGYPLGTLCVLDDKPKELTNEQKISLKALARQVVALFELRKANIELEKSKQQLTDVNGELENFAHVVAHDLKSPANNIISVADLLVTSYGDKLDEEGYQLLGFLKTSSANLKNLIDSILKHARTVHLLSEDKERMSFSGLMEQVKAFVPLPPDFEIRYEGNDSTMLASASALLQIFINLCNNAVKYNDKEHGIITVSYVEQEYLYAFSVTDNGMGIPESSYKDIFGLFRTLGQKDKFNSSGHGIGLNTVKKLVERLGGEISVSSIVGEGTTFTFTISK